MTVGPEGASAVTMSSTRALMPIGDNSWMQGMRPGHVVELNVYGYTMIGKLMRIAEDNVTVRIPIEEQSGDLRRFSVTGMALISLDGAAAQVPVSGQSKGESVRLQFIGPTEIIQRRRHVRVPLSVPARLVWRSGSRGPWNWAESHTVDISVGGVRVGSARVVWPSLGEDVDVLIQLPKVAINERAIVLGKTPDYDLRLSFHGASPQTRQAIEALIR
jgi:hypothetical protein